MNKHSSAEVLQSLFIRLRNIDFTVNVAAAYHDYAVNIHVNINAYTYTCTNPAGHDIFSRVSTLNRRCIYT